MPFSHWTTPVRRQQSSKTPGWISTRGGTKPISYSKDQVQPGFSSHRISSKGSVSQNSYRWSESTFVLPFFNDPKYLPTRQTRTLLLMMFRITLKQPTLLLNPYTRLSTSNTPWMPWVTSHDYPIAINFLNLFSLSQMCNAIFNCFALTPSQHLHKHKIKTKKNLLN